MSSQGPSTGTSTGSGASNCFGNTQNSQVPGEYTFSRVSIRDGSDWIAYKKQALIFATEKNKSGVTKNQWAQYGNDYRTQWQLGRYKTNGGPPNCNGCSTSAFAGNGPDM